MSLVSKIRKREINWSFLLNANTITAVLNVAGVFLIPVIGEDGWATITLIAVNAFNFLFNLLRPSKASLKVKLLPVTPEIAKI